MTANEIRDSLTGVEKWVENHGYKGYEPFDGLSSFIRPLTFGSLTLERVLLQVVRRSVINLRPILGIRPLDSTIGQGYMAWGYLIMLKAGGSREYENKARKCLNWLMENRAPGYAEFCWGKHFDFASREGRYPKLEPITVWTCLIGMAFIEAYEVLGERQYLGVADSICRWVMGLSRTETETGFCLSYTGSGTTACTIHNHNMIAAAFLSKCAKHLAKDEYMKVARGAMQFSCSRQLPDGAWYYGEESMNHWIDNFHTGYNLDSIKCFIESTGDECYMPNLRKGLDFYMKHFFEEDGRPRYYHDKTFPVDSQCIAQSIDTLANFAALDPAALALAHKVAAWTIRNMQDRKGFIYFRQYRYAKARTPMLHWAQATTYKALALLFSACTDGRTGK